MNYINEKDNFISELQEQINNQPALKNNQNTS